MEIIEKFTDLITPIVEKAGYELVDIEYKKIYGQMNLNIFIYKKGGVSLEDCEKVNNLLNLPLEENDITEGVPYILNISSPGLDREIKTDKDLKRNIDEEIELFFITPVKKKKSIAGKLISFSDDEIKIYSKTSNLTIKRNNIKKILPYIKF